MKVSECLFVLTRVALGVEVARSLDVHIMRYLLVAVVGKEKGTKEIREEEKERKKERERKQLGKICRSICICLSTFGD